MKQLKAPGLRAPKAPRWASRALIIEALVLMAVLSCCIAIVAQGLSVAAATALDAQQLTQASAYASEMAERFCANPEQVPVEETSGDLQVVVARTSEPTATGTLWRATILVYQVGPQGQKAKASEALGAAQAGVAAGGSEAQEISRVTQEPLCSLATARFVPREVG